MTRPLDPQNACSTHTDVPATVVCIMCEQRWCAPCSTFRHPRGDFSVCPRCQGQGRLQTFAPEVGGVDFTRSLAGAFQFPLVGRGWGILIGGGLINAFLGFSLGLGGLVFPIPALLISFVILSYFWRFLLSIVTETAEGQDEMPEWPDLGALDETIAPVFRLVAALALCFWPAIIGRLLGPLPGPVMLLLNLLGVALLPMHVLILALGGRLSDLNPLVVWPAILRAGFPYVIAVGVLAITVAIQGGGSALVGILSVVGIAGGLLTGLIAMTLAGSLSIYFLAVQMRMIGLMYRSRRSALDLV
jgi:uncharacterized protein YhhL (DUF1145 family)